MMPSSPFPFPFLFRLVPGSFPFWGFLFPPHPPNLLPNFSWVPSHHNPDQTALLRIILALLILLIILLILALFLVHVFHIFYLIRSPAKAPCARSQSTRLPTSLAPLPGPYNECSNSSSKYKFLGPVVRLLAPLPSSSLLARLLKIFFYELGQVAIAFNVCVFLIPWMSTHMVAPRTSMTASGCNANCLVTRSAVFGFILPRADRFIQFTKNVADG